MSERAAEIETLEDTITLLLEEDSAFAQTYQPHQSTRHALRTGVSALRKAIKLLSSLPPVRGEQETRDELSNLVDAANAAWRDLDDWRRLAEAQRATHSDPQHTPQMPTEAGIAETKKIVGWLGRAIGPVEHRLLGLSAPVRAEAVKTDTPFGRLYGSMPDITDEDIAAASPVREAEPAPQPCQAAQYRPGGVFMFNTTTRQMENCEGDVFVRASASPVREAEPEAHDWMTADDPRMDRWPALKQSMGGGRWCYRCGVAERRDGKNKPCKGVMPRIGLREAEPLKALSDYIEDDWPVAVANIRDRCEASVIMFSNDDVSIVVDEYERLRKLCSAALEGAATKGPN